MVTRASSMSVTFPWLGVVTNNPSPGTQDASLQVVGNPRLKHESGCGCGRGKPRAGAELSPSVWASGTSGGFSRLVPPPPGPTLPHSRGRERESIYSDRISKSSTSARVADSEPVTVVGWRRVPLWRGEGACPLPRPVPPGTNSQGNEDAIPSGNVWESGSTPGDDATCTPNLCP